jgi:hypothetical protein
MCFLFDLTSVYYHENAGANNQQLLIHYAKARPECFRFTLSFCETIPS